MGRPAPTVRLAIVDWRAARAVVRLTRVADGPAGDAGARSAGGPEPAAAAGAASMTPRRRNSLAPVYPTERFPIPGSHDDPHSFDPRII
jgi:hypothetical protein